MKCATTTTRHETHSARSPRRTTQWQGQMTQDLPPELWGEILDVVLVKDPFQYARLALVSRLFLRLIQRSSIVYETNNAGITTITPSYNIVSPLIPEDSEREIQKYLEAGHTAPKLILYRNSKVAGDIQKFNTFYEDAVSSKQLYAMVVRELTLCGLRIPATQEQLVSPQDRGSSYTKYIDHTVFKTPQDEEAMVERIPQFIYKPLFDHLYHFRVLDPERCEKLYYVSTFRRKPFSRKCDEAGLLLRSHVTPNAGQRGITSEAMDRLNGQ